MNVGGWGTKEWMSGRRTSGCLDGIGWVDRWLVVWLEEGLDG